MMQRVQEITPEETVEEDYNTHIDLVKQERICFWVSRTERVVGL